LIKAGALFAACRSRPQYSGPAAEQGRSDRMIEAGIRYFLNFVDYIAVFL